MKQVFILAHHEARRRAMQAVADAPDGFSVTVAEPKKKREQEEKYHAMIGEIAAHCLHHGRKLNPESWKRLLVEAMVYILRDEARAQGEPDPFPQEAKLLPSLDGMRIVQVEVLTRNFTVSQGSKFIDYLYAFGAERGVQFREAVAA